VEPPSLYLQEISQILSNIGVEVEINIGEGEVVDSIINVADRGDYDLLVVGIRVGKLRRAALAQSMTRRILMKAVRPALVFKIPAPR
jgi:nucleotide-binding universal stress UspA family protein